MVFEPKHVITNIITVTVLSGILLIALPAYAEQVIPLNQDDIKYIYDADTFFVHFPECPNNKRGVRVMGVDSSEIRGKCQAEKILARQAKQFAVSKIRSAKAIELIPNPKRRYDRYDRLLAWVRLDGQDLGEVLIHEALGREYNGGKRKGWCGDE